MPVNHAKEYLIFGHIGVVFLHFLARASNGRQYSNFENKCPKLGTGTPEDVVLTNLGDSLDSDPSGFVLVFIQHECSHNVAFLGRKHFLMTISPPG